MSSLRGDIPISINIHKYNPLICTPRAFKLFINYDLHSLSVAIIEVVLWRGKATLLLSLQDFKSLERTLSIFLSRLMWMVRHLIKFAVHKVISELFEKCYAQLSLIITQWKLASKLLSLMMIHSLTSAVPLWSSGAFFLKFTFFFCQSSKKTVMYF